MSDSPVRDYRFIEIDDGGSGGYTNRIFIGHAVTGLVRIEWHQARIGQMVPMNWSQVEMLEYMSGFYPLGYQVADAQNLIVKAAIERDFEWLLLWEHDVLPPSNAFMLLDKYLREKNAPVVSGLYYSRSRPSAPVMFRGRGTSFYDEFEMGEEVWCDGVPTGFLLVHMGIIRAMWDESPEYRLNDKITRRVFETPRDAWFDQNTGNFATKSGTSDLEWCTRVMKEGFFEKAGWNEYQEMEYPFLVDTNLFCYHINPDGEKFP